MFAQMATSLITLSLAKNSHFSFLPSHFPSLPSEMVIIVALKFAMTSHFRCQKTSSSLFRISQMARAARRVIEWSNPAPSYIVLPIEKLNQINTKNSWLEIEKEIVCEVARGDKPYLRKSTDRKAQIRKAFVQFSGLICALQSVNFLR